jgi:hypothetical protein
MSRRPSARSLAACVLVGGLLVVLADIACSRAVQAKLIEEDGVVADTSPIDDFARDDGVSTLGTRWRTITDQVMGGVSTGSHTFGTVDGRPAIRLRGKVSLENNGGFVQAQLRFDEKERLFDASAFEGIRFWARGNGETYSIHLRSSRTWLPWQYFHGDFVASETWTKVELPFEQFKPESFRLPASLNPAKLKSIGIVAIEKEFEADVAVANIELYR